MTYFPIQPRYYAYTDTLGDPLDNGYIYFGRAGLDPVTYPAKAAWDESGLYPITFPVRTMNGYPLRDGFPSQMYLCFDCNDEYSVLINDADGDEVFSSSTEGLSGYFPSDTGGDADTLNGQPASYYAVDADVVHLTGAETITGEKTFTSTTGIKIDSSTAASLTLDCASTSSTSRIFFAAAGTNVGSISYNPDPTSTADRISLNVGSTATEVLGATGAGHIFVNNAIYLGLSSGGNSLVQFYDLANTTYRQLYWNNSASDWYVEDSGGVNRLLYHAGNDGAGSGLDADLLDGQEGSYYAVAPEEGTFTPVLEGLTTAGEGTYTTQYGRYQKIGNWVHFRIGLTWTDHTGTGNMIITGLPYTSSASTENSICAVEAINLTYTGDYVVAAVNYAGDQVTPKVVTTGAASALIPIDTAATLRISGSYLAA